MNRILEVCLVALTLATAITPSAAAKPVAEAQNSSFAGTDAPAQASPAQQRGISVQMPVTANAVPMPEADNQGAWIVTVTADGNVDFGIDPVSPAALADRMRSRPRNRGQNLYVKADARVPYADVEKVLQAAHSDMFEAVELLTSQPEPSQPDSSQPGAMVSPKGLEVLLVPPTGAQPTQVQVINSGQHTPTLNINNRQIPWANLQNMLTQLLQNRPEKVVLVKADGRLPFADIVHVVDVCRSAGAKVVLAVPEL